MFENTATKFEMVMSLSAATCWLSVRRHRRQCRPPWSDAVATAAATTASSSAVQMSVEVEFAAPPSSPILTTAVAAAAADFVIPSERRRRVPSYPPRFNSAAGGSQVWAIITQFYSVSFLVKKIVASRQQVVWEETTLVLESLVPSNNSLISILHPWGLNLASGATEIHYKPFQGSVLS